MDFFDAVRARRSIRKFLPDPVPEEVMERAFDAAILAPNSSNMQTWDFHWVRMPEKKARLVEFCLGQSAARTAAELVVVSADPDLWRRSQPEVLRYVEEVAAPEPVKVYYRKLIPVTYGWGFFNLLAPLKWLTSTLPGLFRPMPRGPHTRRDGQEVAIKSAALAAENLVLAIAAQGYNSCMMEGFDEWRVKRLLGLRGASRVLMVIAIGKEGERGTWGPQFRLPKDRVVHRI
ncbi:MAG: nitroreductase family protein [bacterium]|nr:nitroreductase family protein [bacterium]